MDQKYINEYKEFLNQWNDIKTNGSEIWEAIIDSYGNYKLIKKDSINS
jgi:hypothetical protein